MSNNTGWQLVQPQTEHTIIPSFPGGFRYTRPALLTTPWTRPRPNCFPAHTTRPHFIIGPLHAVDIIMPHPNALRPPAGMEATPAEREPLMPPGESVSPSSAPSCPDASTLFVGESSTEKRPLPPNRHFHLKERWWALIGVTSFLASLILFYLSSRDHTRQCTRRLSAYCKSQTHCALTYSTLSL